MSVGSNVQVLQTKMTTRAGGAGGAGGSGGAGGGPPPECDSLPAGPLEPVAVVTVFNGSEDLAFDGKGKIAAKKGTDILLSDAAGTTSHADQISQLAALRDQGTISEAEFAAGKAKILA